MTPHASAADKTPPAESPSGFFAPTGTEALPSELPALRLVQTPDAALTLARLVTAFFLVTLLALIVTPWQQTGTGSGRVIAFAPLERQQTVEAPIDGAIARWYVQEGSKVKQGDRLVDLRDNDRHLIERLQQEQAALRNRLAAAETRVRAFDGRIGELAGSRSFALEGAGRRFQMALDRTQAAERAVEAATAAHATAVLNLARQRAMAANGLAATRAVELAELEARKTQTDQARAEASLRAARHEAASLLADQRKVGTDMAAVMEDARASRAAAEAEVASAQAELTRLQVRLSRQETQAVKAPRDGTILRLMANQGGEMVKAGDSLAVIVPDTTERAVELWVNGNDVPLITEGRHVRLQFEGWPALQFSGWPSVAVGTFGGHVAFVDATDNGKGEFRVVVVHDGRAAPWPEVRYLRQGVRAHGWILLNRVPLYYELWRQFNGFPPAVPTAPESKQGPSPLGPVKGGK